MIHCQKILLPSVFLFFLAISQPACDQQQEIVVPVVQEVVSIKIPSMKKVVNVEQPSDPSLKKEPIGKQIVPVNKTEDLTVLSTKDESVEEIKIPNESQEQDVNKKHEKGQKEPLQGLEQKSIDDQDIDLVSSEKGIAMDSVDSDLEETSFKSLIVVDEDHQFYSGEGKVDPFDPLIKDTPAAAQQTIEVKDEVPHRILTPLEKLNFTQMKLVAILNKDSGNIAMVQESSGKGYLVGIGTHIGQNSGQVVKIERDKLVIQELVKDYKGNVVERFQEMKLNKLDDKG